MSGIREQRAIARKRELAEEAAAAKLEAIKQANAAYTSLVADSAAAHEAYRAANDVAWAEQTNVRRLQRNMQDLTVERARIDKQRLDAAAERQTHAAKLAELEIELAAALQTEAKAKEELRAAAQKSVSITEQLDPMKKAIETAFALEDPETAATVAKMREELARTIKRLEEWIAGTPTIPSLKAKLVAAQQAEAAIAEEYAAAVANTSAERAATAEAARYAEALAAAAPTYTEPESEDFPLGFVQMEEPGNSKSRHKPGWAAGRRGRSHPGWQARRKYWGGLPAVERLRWALDVWCSSYHMDSASRAEYAARSAAHAEHASQLTALEPAWQALDSAKKIADEAHTNRYKIFCKLEKAQNVTNELKQAEGTAKAKIDDLIRDTEQEIRIVIARYIFRIECSKSRRRFGSLNV